MFQFPELVQEKDSLHKPNFKDFNTSTDPEEFINFLDNHFIPEIKLEEESQVPSITFSDKNEDIELDSSIKGSISGDNRNKVKICYTGNKNRYKKGTFAERIDVVYKTLLRSTRRYVWALFTSEFNIKSITDRKRSSHIFKNMVEKFYGKHYKEFHHQIKDVTEEDEEIFLENLATFLTKNYWVPENTFRIRRFRTLMTSNVNQYSSKKYKLFFEYPG